MNLSQLTAQFLGLMNRRDLSANSTLVTTFINSAIMRIQRELRCPANEKWVDVVIGSTYTGLLIPNDYLELIGVYPNADFTVRCRPDKLERVMNYAKFATDKALLYARKGNSWILGPSPVAGDVITIAYYCELAPLLSGADTNIISTIAWDLIVSGALTEACAYYNDKRQPAFDAKYTQILGTLNDMGAEDELAEARMEPTYSFPDDDTDNYEIWVP